MPIIGHVGRRSLKMRILNAGIHLVLIVGAVTMVYPLLLMLSGSVKSAVDSKRLNVFPAYLSDDEELYKKWVETKYNELTAEYSYCHRRRIYSFDFLSLPPKPVPQRCLDWHEFLDQTQDRLNEFHFSLGNANGHGVKPELLRKFVSELKKSPDVQGSLARLNRRHGAAFDSWEAVTIPVYNLLRRELTGNFTDFNRGALAFARRQDRRHLNFYSLDSFFVEGILKVRVSNDLRTLNQKLHTGFRAWHEVTLPRGVPADGLRDEWLFFVRRLVNLQFVTVSDEAAPDYHAFLKERYKTISLLNNRYDTHYTSFSQIPILKEIPRTGIPLADWDYFITNLAQPEHLGLRSTEFLYRDFLKRKYGRIEQLLTAHQLGLQRQDELALTAMLPSGNIAYEDDWLEFVGRLGDSDWLQPEIGATPAWREFLTAPYRVDGKLDLDALNAAFGTNFERITDISVPVTPPANRKLAARRRQFIRDACPKNLLVLDTARALPRWRQFIRAKYPAVRDLNRHYAYAPANFAKVNMPLEDVEYYDFQKTKSHTRWEFLIRNYATVMATMLYDGRTIVNTVIYCALAVAIALIVNPLAAYALSRYKPPSQYKLLLLLMLTMAFPPIVLGIPNFLLLRRLDLLNTFAALVLPSAASGYSIFLLKGFFDSLPRELYESATLDGASEWTMFWQITMATSKPILAVVALGAFTAAYSNFMFAFIVCQNPKMWTMMVSIYQLQQRSSQSVSFAALVIAAIPTLLVFVFCQNIIIRGIVVPTEK